MRAPPTALSCSPALPAAGGNWAGAYAGGTASWQRGDFQQQGRAKANGFGGGVYGGYNMQSGQIVYGGEADLNYSGVDSKHAGRSAQQGRAMEGIHGLPPCIGMWWRMGWVPGPECG